MGELGQFVDDAIAAEQQEQQAAAADGANHSGNRPVRSPEAERRHEERVTTLVGLMIARLQPFVDGA